MLGTGKKVEARTTEEVGQSGAVFVAVILVPGTGCIGAYLVKPSCSLYGVPHAPAAAAPAPAAGAAAATWLILSGPVVPTTVFKAAVTAALKVPVIPVRVNRFEKFVTVPPAVAVDMMPRKLTFVNYC
jgi:hypothetical protein